MPAVNPMPGDNYQIGFWLQEQGAYSLYKLSVTVARAYRSRADPNQLRGLGGGSLKRDEITPGSGGILIASMPKPLESPAYYLVVMNARNGQWEEIVEARVVDSTHAFHWAVYGSFSVTPAHIYGPYKKLLDLRDGNFPDTDRRELKYPLNPQLLPLEPLAQISR